MARLAFLLCIVLTLCAVLISAREISGYKRSFGGLKRGTGGASQGGQSQGGKSQGGKSQGGKSQGGKSQGSGSGESGDASEEREVTPITKAEFKSNLMLFAGVFKSASDGLAELEALSQKASDSGSVGDWLAFFYKFVSVVSTDLAKLEPAIEELGHTMERIAASPDEFAPVPYCDSSIKLAYGQTAIVTTLDDAREVALIEDLGCFKDKLFKVTELDLEAAGKPEFTELQAIRVYVDILEEVTLMGRAFERFGAAQEELDKQTSSKRGLGNADADVAQLIHLLRQLKLDRRR